MQHNMTAINYNNHLYERGEIDEAIADYNKAIALNPNYEIAYNNRGVVYQTKGNVDKAITDYNKALALNPNFEIAYDNRGTAYKKQRRFAEAFFDYNKALALNPNYEFARRNLGHLVRTRCSTEIFASIKKLPPINQIPILKQCLKPGCDEAGVLTYLIQDRVRQEIEKYLSGLVKSMATWIFLSGPRLVYDGRLVPDTFLLITSCFLEVNFSAVNKFQPKIDKFQLTMFPKRRHDKPDEHKAEITDPNTCTVSW